MPVRTPSPSSHRHPEADTIRKSRFFHAVDTRGGKKLKEVCATENVAERTGRYWLRQRSVIGNLHAIHFSGPVQFPPSLPTVISLRSIYIQTGSGSVKGLYPLYDRLSVITVSGLVDLDLDLQNTTILDRNTLDEIVGVKSRIAYNQCPESRFREPALGYLSKQTALDDVEFFDD